MECSSHGDYTGKRCPHCMTTKDVAMWMRALRMDQPSRGKSKRKRRLPGPSAAKRMALLLFMAGRDGALCCWCSRTVVIRRIEPGQIAGDDATIEHVIPLSRGGGNEPANLKIACWKCNSERGAPAL